MVDSIAKILQYEWEMFTVVNNMGGRAECQDQYGTFSIMRTAQAEVWSEELRQSYLCYLEQAKAEGRNLMTEKYARIMKYTHPDEYELLKDQLPPVTPRMDELVERITRRFQEWTAQTNAKYRALSMLGRPATDGGASMISSVSTASYMKGELYTYGEEALELYDALVEQAIRDGRNLQEEILLSTVKQYGYSSIEEADKAMGVMMMRSMAGGTVPPVSGSCG